MVLFDLANQGVFGPLYQQWLRGDGYDPEVLARRVPERFTTSPYLAEDYRLKTEDRGVMPVPGGQLARRPIDAMAPDERDRYASDWERMDTQRQAAYRAMPAPAKAGYADWRQDFDRTNYAPPAETTSEHAADLLGSILAASATPEGFIGFVPKSVNALAGVAKSPSLAQGMVDGVNAVVQSVRNRLGRNARPDEVIQAMPARSPIWTSTTTRSSVENAYWHWTKHRAEFPELYNAKQYAEDAKGFLVNPPPGAAAQIRANSDRLVYDAQTNTFGVQAPSGAPRTYFRPRSGIEYWNDQ
jgi:hypothetical protein